ncbi:MAG: lytic transglycosylase domain-containing protein [Pyrinomonadaceae bacterium]
MKRKIVVVSLLALVVPFGGRWMTRTERAEETKLAISYAAVGDVSEPRPPAPIIQPHYEVELIRQIASYNPVRASPEWRERAAQYEPLIQSAALRHGVDARWLWIIAYLETRFRPELVSPKGARGLMQFTDATAERYSLENPHDPATSIDAAARYLRDLSMRFGNRLDLVLAGYNAGEGAVDAYLKGYALRLPGGRIVNPRGLKLGGIPPYAETRNYVSNGLTIARQLSVPDIPAISINTPAKRRTFDGANGSSIFALRRATSQPSQPTAQTGTSAERETVIRSIRVFTSAATNSVQ